MRNLRYAGFNKFQSTARFGGQKFDILRFKFTALWHQPGSLTDQAFANVEKIDIA